MMDAGQLRGLCIDYPNSVFLLALRTNVVCASKNSLLLQSSPEAAGSGFGERFFLSWVEFPKEWLKNHLSITGASW